MANSAIVGTLRAILTLDTADFEKHAGQVSKSAEAWSKDFKSLGQQATALGSSLTKFVTLPIAGVFASSAKAAMDFESSFAGVKKTVEATDQEFAAMAQQMRNLAKEIPVNVNELNRLGEAAGAMGIPKEEIVDFTRVMALLGVTTNLTSEQAAESIGKIQNIFGAAGKDTEQFASTLVALGNAGASTETEIVKMAARIAGAGHSVGLTQAQVLSFASTLASVGIEAEAGGSAISRIFLKMNDAVMDGGAAMDEFARVAGISSAAFKKAFEEDASKAMVLFVNGLGRLKAEGENTNATMEGMIGKNIILKDTLNRLTGSGKLLQEQLDLGNKAWRENSALTIEAGKRFETTQAQLTLLWNRVKDLGITIGNALLPAIKSTVDMLGKLMPIAENAAMFFANLPGPVQATALGLLALVAAAGPLLIVFGQMAMAAGQLTAMFGAKGLLSSFSSLFASFSGGTGIVTVFFRALSLLTGPVGWFVGAAAGVLTATGTWDELFRILKAGAEIVYNITAAIIGFGVGVVQWFGEVTGATEIISGVFDVFVQVLKIVSGEIAKFMGFLATVLEGLAAVTGGMERELAKVDIASPFKKLIGEGLGPALTATEALKMAQEREREELEKGIKTTGRAALSKEELEKADKKAQKAAKELADEIERQEQALSSLGIVTEKEVNAKILELTNLQELATKQGVPLVASLKAQETVLKALAAKAKAAGLEFEHLNLLIQDLDRQIRALSPTPQALSVKMGLPAVITGLQEVNQEQIKAYSESRILSSAFQALGITSQASFAAQAEAARRAYTDILRSGTATKDELIAARQAVLDAEIAAGQRTVGIWEGEIKPAIQSALMGIGESVATHFTDLIGHANRWRDAFMAIWDDIKNIFNDILSQMLSNFINGFLKGLFDGMSSFGRYLGQVLSGGGSGGGLIPGVGGGGGGVGSAGAGGSGAGAGGTGAGTGVLQTGLAEVGTTFAMFDLLFKGLGMDKGLLEGMIDAWMNPTTPPMTIDEQWAALVGYMGADSYAAEQFLLENPDFQVPGFTTGTNGQYVDFGAGTLAMLHGREMITPEGADVSKSSGWGVGNMTVIIERDGRAEAEFIVPYLPGAVRRLGLAGVF